jgi:condensin complex subunit 1
MGQARTGFVVASLMQMTQGANMGDLRSIQELACTMMGEGIISDAVVKQLWDTFAKGGQEDDDDVKSNQTDSVEKQRLAVMILAMCAQAEPSIIKSNVGVLVNAGFGRKGLLSWVLWRSLA